MSDYKNPEKLRELHIEEGLHMSEMGRRMGCSQDTIRRYMKQYNIPIQYRKGGVEPKNSGIIEFRSRVGPEGMLYEVWENTDFLVPVHRLLAVSVFDFDAVKGKHVHHKNGIPWDNRPSNIELHTASRHTTKHMEEKYELDTEVLRDKEELERLYWEEKLSLQDIAEQAGCSQENVHQWFEKHNIPRRKPGFNYRNIR